MHFFQTLNYFPHNLWSAFEISQRDRGDTQSNSILIYLTVYLSYLQTLSIHFLFHTLLFLSLSRSLCQSFSVILSLCLYIILLVSPNWSAVNIHLSNIYYNSHTFPIKFGSCFSWCELVGSRRPDGRKIPTHLQRESVSPSGSVASTSSQK
jgi:hypothetical protein